MIVVMIIFLNKTIIVNSSVLIQRPFMVFTSSVFTQSGRNQHEWTVDSFSTVIQRICFSKIPWVKIIFEI